MILVSIYLTLGLLAAAGHYYMINEALKVRHQIPGMSEALDAVENPTSKIPGGMVTVLIIIVITWPLFAAALLKGALAHRRETRR